MNHLRTALETATDAPPSVVTAASLSIPITTNINGARLQSQPKTYYPDDQLIQEILNLDFNFNPHEPSITETILITGIHPTLGLYKIDPVTIKPDPKPRGTCDGSSRTGHPVILEETYASCLEHTAHRLVWALTAALNYIAAECDVRNAFTEANGPKNRYYTQVDEPSWIGGQTS
mmetsp:Transcript_5045/g.7734  ORF Transcript_5045/g.7734 Transcript_5045/m.7734 type:complete len:175 (-) Transcript_5045:667-1191(-)